VRTARERGMAVLTTTGVQSEAHLPFAGLHQLLRPVRERATELPEIQRVALDAAFGLTHEAAPGQYRIAMAVLDLVSEVASDAPLMLVVEDAHWLDHPTSDVLAFVARRIESDPIVLLAATREGYPSVLLDAGLPERTLAGLDEVTAAAVLDAAAPDLPLFVRTQVLREAAGNPFALRSGAVAAPACESVKPTTTRLAAPAPSRTLSAATGEASSARAIRAGAAASARPTLSHTQPMKTSAATSEADSAATDHDASYASDVAAAAHPPAAPAITRLAASPGRPIRVLGAPGSRARFTTGP